MNDNFDCTYSYITDITKRMVRMIIRHLYDTYGSWEAVMSQLFPENAEGSFTDRLEYHIGWVVNYIYEQLTAAAPKCSMEVTVSLQCAKLIVYRGFLGVNADIKESNDGAYHFAELDELLTFGDDEDGDDDE